MDDLTYGAAAAFRGRRVAVTGGLGFVGSALVRSLVSLGAEVAVLDSLEPGGGGRLENLADVDGVEIRVGNLCDEPLTRSLLAGRDLVFNLAGRTGHAESMLEPLADLDANCRAQLVLLEACRRSRPERVVFTSTRQVYGRPLALPVVETHPLAPVDVNGVHKLAAERYHRLYHDVYGLGVTVLRLTNTYGPRMRVADARQSFLGLWLGEVLAGRVLEVYGDGAQVRDLLHVDDAVRALLLAGACDAADGEVLNVGGCAATSLAALAALVVEVAGRGSIRFVPFPDSRSRIDIGDFVADCARARELLGWAPSVQLREGLAGTIASFRDAPASVA